MADRMTVVLPEPASPISSVIPFRLAIPYSMLLMASRCASVSTRNRGSGVRSNGRSRKPKKRSYIVSSVQERIGHDRQAPDDDGSQTAADGEPASEPPPPLVVGLHQRHHGKHWQCEFSYEISVGSEAVITVLNQQTETDS